MLFSRMRTRKKTIDHWSRRTRTSVVVVVIVLVVVLTAVTVVSKSCSSLQIGNNSIPPTVNTLHSNVKTVSAHLTAFIIVGKSTCNIETCTTEDKLKIVGGVVVRPLVLADELSLSCARLTAGRVTTLWVKHPLSVNQHGQLSQPSLRGRLNE